MHMVLYIDGSHRPVPKEKRAAVGGRDVVGYGLVALHRDCATEQFGGLVVPHEASGDHEFFALVVGVKFALAAGVPFEQLSICTDEELIVYAPQALHAGNFWQSRADSVRERLQRVCRVLQMPEMFEETLRCLVTSRFTKIKAHRYSVYQNRTDYLAKCGSYSAMGKMPVVQPYDDWLKKGFMFYINDGADTEFWFPPFVAELAAG